MVEAPCGEWRSPISASDVARGGVRLSRPYFDDMGRLWWAESRPSEGGRSVVVRRDDEGIPRDVLPPGWNARTRVHEYGGRAWVPTSEGGLVFANWEDQRLYRLDPRSAAGAAGDIEPVALTPKPAEPQGARYADLVLTPDGSEVVCVRERDVEGTPSVTRDLVAVSLDGSFSVRLLLVDRHFLSNPRISPDGRHLSWLAWDHPRMPWDGTELRVGEISPGGAVEGGRTILGGQDESVFQPEWSSSEALYAVSDRSGWWNLYRVGLGGDLVALCEKEEEFGWPQWIFGMSTYGELEDGRLAVIHGTGTWSLSLFDPRDRTLVPASSGLERRFSHFEPTVSVRGMTVAVVGGGASTPDSILCVEASTGTFEVARPSIDRVPDSRYLPEARPQVFAGERGRDVHAFVYAPRNPDFEAAEGELPPYVVFVHGGPTAQTSPVLDLAVAYFTSRGIGVLDVDYGGSTGYGREYRNRLRGQWGIVDVEDVVSAAKGLAARGEADPGRVVIRGGSAGGWTVLTALTRTDAFAGGTSYYGVADLMGLVEDTHDFESRYIDGLVGPLPEARSVYDERSPLSHVEELGCPILLLQGTEDRIVPPSQAEAFRDAMLRKGIPHAYIAFDGEQHGFRKAENIERALEAELSFYGQVLGFEPPGIPLLELTGAAG